ncbi:hypothetical protein PENTCL1PPCAC_15038 [Pristionchus entomophagus]|uniref:Uncharacterized protein n=1 Tax=Pristionchus entomophagus TaxID=358040 RepID=A0AAV5TGB3_9BILA|nr:hypothetical protein PENTCL1PPCAC_15038 [Pristionchus entomophagus]
MTICILLSVVLHLTYEKWYLTLSDSRTIALVSVLYLLCFSSIFHNFSKKPPTLATGRFNPAEELLRWEPGSTTNFTEDQVQMMNKLMGE